MTIKPLRVEIKIRNNALIKRREELGMSAPQFAKAAGVHYTTYVAFESMKDSPIYKDCLQNRRHGFVGWKEVAFRIAQYHGVSPDVLWPDVILEIAKTRVIVEMDTRDISRLTGAGISQAPALPDAACEDSKRIALVRRVLATLTPREEKVLRMRFGIGDPEDHTLEETGAKMDFNRERARQIEEKALRKLRHPSRSRILKPLIMDVDERGRR